MGNSLLKQRFEKYIMPEPNTGCWFWLATHFKSGYPQFFWGRENGKEKTVKGHRAAWRIYKGEITENLMVLHKCNNRKCVNPEHLYLGNHAQNMKDRDDCGHTSKWDKRYNFKRNDELVAKVMDLKNRGFISDDIAKELNIGRTTVYRCFHQAAG